MGINWLSSLLPSFSKPAHPALVGVYSVGYSLDLSGGKGKAKQTKRQSGRKFN
jgi:hypothetical protein